MRCPQCSANCDRVVDSRSTPENDVIRRRRLCLKCGARFTTYEQIERKLPRVVKRDGRREDFDRAKIERGLLAACQKRPIPSETIARLIDSVLAEVERQGSTEIPTEHVGAFIMERLRALDTIAYIRFASVYSAFDDVQQFIEAIKDIRPARKAGRGARSKRG